MICATKPHFNQENLDDRFVKIAKTRRANTLARNNMIRTRFEYLYNKERKRYDDCLLTVSLQFALSQATVERILKG